MYCSFCASAGAVTAEAPTAAAARTRVARSIVIPPGRSGVLPGLLHEPFHVFGASPARKRTPLLYKPMPSIGVRPESQLFLGGRPKSCKSMRFNDQEPADQRSCDNKDHERNGFDRDRNPERVGHLVEQDRKHQNEARPEERAEDRAKPADDHHEENL